MLYKGKDIHSSGHIQEKEEKEMGERVAKLSQLKEGVRVLYYRLLPKPMVTEHRILGEPYVLKGGDIVVNNVVIRGEIEFAHKPINLFEAGVIFDTLNPRLYGYFLEIKDSVIKNIDAQVRVIPVDTDQGFVAFTQWVNKYQAFPLTLANEGASYYRKISQIMAVVEQEYPKHGVSYTVDMKEDLVRAMAAIAYMWIVAPMVFGHAVKVLGMIGTEKALSELDLLGKQPLIKDSPAHRSLIVEATIKAQTTLELERLNRSKKT
jgi:CRISPR/Cas system-associated exonuclease Cas4 (RecB family)